MASGRSWLNSATTKMNKAMVPPNQRAQRIMRKVEKMRDMGWGSLADGAGFVRKKEVIRCPIQRRRVGVGRRGVRSVCIERRIRGSGLLLSR